MASQGTSAWCEQLGDRLGNPHGYETLRQLAHVVCSSGRSQPEIVLETRLIVDRLRHYGLGFSGRITFIRLLGYTRVSTVGQDARLQLDVVVVWRIDLLCRSPIGGLSTVNLLREKGVDMWSVSDGFDPATRNGWSVVDPHEVVEKLALARGARKRGRTAAETARLVLWSRATFYPHLLSADLWPLEGPAVYCDCFELVLWSQADQPNQSWRGDPTEPDNFIVADDGSAQRPWLTEVMDGYFCVICG